MPLYLIGIGMGNEKDITLRGLELVRDSDVVYLEAYTAVLCDQKAQDRMRELYQKDIVVADRYLVEDGRELIRQAGAENKKISLLVVGDPFAATTHSDLYVRCKEEKITVEVVHNASVMNAVGMAGLQLYRYGMAITLCFWTETWKPDSWKTPLMNNLRHGLHTLVLLDIKTKEVSEENLARGRMNVFEPPRFMSAVEGAKQLLTVLENNADTELATLLTPNTKVVAMARLGAPDQVVLPCTLKELSEVDNDQVLGAPLHCFVVCGTLHEVEEEHLATFPGVPKQ